MESAERTLVYRTSTVSVIEEAVRLLAAEGVSSQHTWTPYAARGAFGVGCAFVADEDADHAAFVLEEWDPG